jgi:hypothetical protein
MVVSKDVKMYSAPAFGITGITSPLFRDLRSAIRFSQQGDDTLISSSQHRWSLVQGIVDPSETICADDSVSRWYGLGGSWIEGALPYYVAIDRRPENGCETKKLRLRTVGIYASTKSCCVCGR